MYESTNEIVRMYNVDKSAPILLDSTSSSIGLINVIVEYNENFLTCRFKRLKSKPDNQKYFNTNTGNQYYLLFATGKTNNLGTISYHGTTKTSSSYMIDFTTITTQPTTVSTTLTPKPKTNVTSTGSLASSIANLKWEVSKFYSDFTFYEGALSQSGRQTNLPTTNRYIAFGFSKDSKMGDDCVVVCKVSNGVGTVEHYYTTGKTTPNYLDPDNPNIGLSNASVSVGNGQIQCKFTRESFIEGNSRYCDSRTSYILLMAKGTLSNGK